MPDTVFANPPVVEVVLGVQFAPLASFTSGHSGWFWKKYLGDEWDRTEDAIPLPDQFERFDKRRIHISGIALRLQTEVTSPRLQICQKDRGRMIQIQPTRFIYNWRGKGTDYPLYGTVKREFFEFLQLFRSFTRDAGLGEPALNQWEVTYVDRVDTGSLWESPADWHRVFPGLVSPSVVPPSVQLESAAGEWHYEIVPAKGRLHLSLQQGLADSGAPTLFLETTARGPVEKNELERCFDIGHAAISEVFLTVASDGAQKLWGKK